ncbi:MAG TPA: hypothetical protein VKF14_21690, partial [Candidatus Dormibacteraeota bacterium]|nr:hypothetical protein [Candidatus Dormibacteraeota bacterium]
GVHRPGHRRIPWQSLPTWPPTGRHQPLGCSGKERPQFAGDQIGAASVVGCGVADPTQGHPASAGQDGAEATRRDVQAVLADLRHAISGFADEAAV